MIKYLTHDFWTYLNYLHNKNDQNKKILSVINHDCVRMFCLFIQILYLYRHRKNSFIIKINDNFNYCSVSIKYFIILLR